MRRRAILGAAAAAAASGVTRAAFAAGTPAPLAVLGRPAPTFEAADTEGRLRRLGEFPGKVVVLEWTSPSCPFAAAQYASGRMQELQKWAAQNGVVWLSVLSSHPSRPDYLDAKAAAAFDRQRGAAPAALLMDESGRMGHAYGAMTANHMFVIDRRGTLVYAGGIDDAESTKPDEVRVAHNHVRAALEDLLAGRPVKKAESEPAGCAISYAS